MQNETRLFTLVPYEDTYIPPETAEKKSTVVLEFPKKNILSEEKIEKCAERDTYEIKNKRRVISILENVGVLDHVNGMNIFDLEKFLGENFFDDELRSKNFTIEGGKRKNLSKVMLFDAISDMLVISRQEYLVSLTDGKEPQEKPLFNIPESIDDAFDTEKIKSEEYYLNYWDIFGSDEIKQVNWQHEMTAKNGEHLNMKEFAIATEIFGKFQGRRDENGNLLVLDPKKNEFIKLNVDWLADNVTGFNGSNFDASVHGFLLHQCPNLLKCGTIKLEDFQVFTSTASGKLLRKEKKMNSSSPEIMLGGVKYYIGRENFIFNAESIPIENIKVVVLDKNTAGIILLNGGQEKVLCLVDLLSDEEKEQKRGVVRAAFERPLKEKEVTARTFLNKKEMQNRIHPWLRTQDNPKHENESPENYAERISSIADYGYIKKVTDDFSLQSELGIHNLSWREQQWLVSAAFDLKGDYLKLLEFGKIYGIEGLKTFLSCEYGLEHGKEILRIGENLSPETASFIFAKYNEISQSAEDIKTLLDKFLKGEVSNENEEREKTQELLLKKAKDILLQFSQNLKTKNKVDERLVLLELEKIKTDNIFLTSILKSFAKENSDLSFGDFKGLYFETVAGKEFSKEGYTTDVERMKDIIRKNYATNEAMRELVIESLQDGFEKESSDFYVLRHDGEIVAFCRFDDEGEHYYAGSFNVDEDYRGSSIGEVMMRESLDRKAEIKPVHAVTDPKKIICSKYIEDEGFIINEILYTKTDKGILTEVNIVRDDKQNDQYEYRTRYHLEDLEKAYALQQQEINDGTQSRLAILKSKQSFIATFEKDQEMEKFLKLADKLIKDYNYVITRYLPTEKEGKKIFATFEHKL